MILGRSGKELTGLHRTDLGRTGCLPGATSLGDARRMATIHNHKLKTLEGLPVALDDFRGRALLIVNVASQCGLTPQYAGLQQLFETYSGRGLSVLGFPCNQFAGQEPGTAEEIQTFC